MLTSIVSILLPLLLLRKSRGDEDEAFRVCIYGKRWADINCSNSQYQFVWHPTYTSNCNRFLYSIANVTTLDEVQKDAYYLFLERPSYSMEWEEKFNLSSACKISFNDQAAYRVGYAYKHFKLEDLIEVPFEKKEKEVLWAVSNCIATRMKIAKRINETFPFAFRGISIHFNFDLKENALRKTQRKTSIH